jgi:pimeloyl-ACP methyl ester carboxylesterase
LAATARTSSAPQSRASWTARLLISRQRSWSQTKFAAHDASQPHRSISGTEASDDVQSFVVPGAGHFVAEEAPEEMLQALRAFLAPYRDGAAADDRRAPVVAAAPG